MRVLSDIQWDLLEPLLEAVRPQTGRELTNLRRTFEAIVWRLQNGVATGRKPVRKRPRNAVFPGLS
jgi:transposase